jgi:hypothetical protein
MEIEEDDEMSSGITLRRNTIHNLKCISKEVPAAVENDDVVKDVRGAVFQFFDTFSNDGLAAYVTNFTYRGNVLADAQIMTASAIHDGIVFDVDHDNDSPNPLYLTHLNTISPNIVKWANGIPSSKSLEVPTYQPKYRCHGDAMHHTAIGMVGIRLEETYVPHGNPYFSYLLTLFLIICVVKNIL